MQLTKYPHACVRLEQDGRVLVLDPGSFSEPAGALAGAHAVLITHEHADHLDTGALSDAARADPGLRVWAPAAVAAGLSDLGDRVTSVSPGDRFEAAGFAVSAHGGQHALIHPSVPVVANVGYLVDGVYHPGDAFAVPTEPVRTLLLPTSGPWQKMAEAIDFAVAVRAPRAHQIHDALLSDIGRGVVERQVTAITGRYGVEFAHLDPGESVEA